MEADLVTLPKEKFVPKAEDNPNRPPNSENYASEIETVKKVLDWSKEYFGAFKTQASRTKFEELMDTADEMMRVSHVKDQLDTDEADNKDVTKTKLVSPTFYRYTRTITAWENAVMLGSHKELPVICEPMPGAAGIREDEAAAQAQYRNVELEYVFDKAGLRDKLADWNFFANKYANVCVEAFYNRQKDERWERKPRTSIVEDLRVAIGKPRRSKWEKGEKVIADWPDFRMHDMRNVWFDHAIDDVQNQSCFVVRDKVQLEKLWAMQKAGDIDNLKNLKLDHRYNRDGDDKVLDERKKNADESGEDFDLTKLWDVWTVWIRVPVDPKDGQWKSDEVICTWWRAMFVGDLEGEPLCVALEHDPYKTNHLPYLIWHIKRDDKGALHMGNVETSSALIEMETSIINLALENIRLRTRRPWIMERGSVNIRDKSFTAGGNRIWMKTPGAADPHELETQDTTQYTVPILQLLDNRIRDIFGVNSPFLAEALGGRTSASEATFVSEQAIKLALEDLIYKANQILPWMAEWIFNLMDTFSDDETVITITKSDKPVEVKPKDVWGAVNVRITSIKTFQDSLIKRKDFLQYLNQVVPVFLKFVSRKGVADIAEQVSKPFGFEHVKEWFDQSDDYDARNMARSENQYILWEGESLLPKPEENQDAHLSEHKPILASYLMLPQEQQNPANVQKMKLHIQMHENFVEQKAQGSSPLAPQQGQVPAPQQGMMAGPEAGAPMAAEAGAAENMPRPEMMQ